MRTPTVAVLTAVLLQAAVTLAAEPSPRLEGYTLALGPVVISNVVEDASGVAYNPETHRLYVIVNGDCTVAVTDTNGVYEGRITLAGFNDTEDLVWLGGRRFAVVEERRRNLVLIDMPDAGGTVRYEACARALIEPQDYKNVGVEGVAFDAAVGRFFIVKEKQPRRIYEVRWDGKQPAEISRPWDLEAHALGMSDVSSAYYDAGTGHLLILSDESHCLVECAPDGREIARLDFAAGSAGLKETLRQSEGVCLDPAGNLYVVCEPNVLYVFRKREKGSD